MSKEQAQREENISRKRPLDCSGPSGMDSTESAPPAPPAPTSARGGRGRGSRGRGRANSSVAGDHHKQQHQQHQQQNKPASSIPDQPTIHPPDEFLHDVAGACDDEIYSNDEKKLNSFLIKHPMLSLEATSQKTLQVVASIFKDSAMICTPELPVIPKSYDDKMLRPAKKNLGERDCICGSNCMCIFLAKFRHGNDTDLAFTCREFLLPSEHDAFVSKGTLPPRRKKCLLCTRYFMSFLYYKSRIDSTFKMGDFKISTQSFANLVSSETVLSSAERRVDVQELLKANDEPIQSASAVLTEDGYRPSAMLFVDEEFVQCQASRSGSMSSLVWQPVVKFTSSHYEFKRDAQGVHYVLQVGIGISQHFGTRPAAEQVAPLG